jgi:hypothetical protein
MGPAGSGRGKLEYYRKPSIKTAILRVLSGGWEKCSDRTPTHVHSSPAIAKYLPFLCCGCYGILSLDKNTASESLSHLGNFRHGVLAIKRLASFHVAERAPNTLVVARVILPH